MNEILITSQEIEENGTTISFSDTIISCSGNFQKILGIAINRVLCEKKNKEIVHLKSERTAISGIFPESQKLDSGMFWALIICIVVQKIRKNNDEISRKCQNTGLLAYFHNIFGRKKTFFFKNRALSQYKYFVSMCKISRKNMKQSSRNSRKTVYLVIIRCSGDF